MYVSNYPQRCPTPVNTMSWSTAVNSMNDTARTDDLLVDLHKNINVSIKGSRDTEEWKDDIEGVWDVTRIGLAVSRA